MNPAFLKVKTAGLPRWAWIAILSGAIVIGVYIRTHGEEEELGPEEELPPESELEEYDGTEQAGGLAAAGLVGPAQGQVLPVEAPYIPQGFVDIFGVQSEQLGTAIGALADREPGERVETEVIHERDPYESPQGLTGGGAPKRKPQQKAAKKKHKKAPKKPAAKKAQKKGRQVKKKIKNKAKGKR